MIRRYFVILIMLLSFGSTFLKAEPRINLKNKIQQLKLKMAEPFDTTRDSTYWKRALQHGKVDMNDSLLTKYNVLQDITTWKTKPFYTQ